eukprot:TRINITY_DN3043_c0_g1_i2.p1 TRINITY_DN3043_c0_g1~~TRINITY_DN3043_c0_g1_i2.p1  ORF type:complete len:151 (+),score=41.43 TRINITY_DN3043_c0_g1_i2:209-661(+)
MEPEMSEEELARLEREYEENREATQFDIDMLKRGCVMTKVSRNGKIRTTRFSLRFDKKAKQYYVCWESDSFWKKDADCEVLLSECEVKEGMHTETFKKTKFPSPPDPDRCFSLVSHSRSVDMIVESAGDYYQWIFTLQALLRTYKRKGTY